MSSRVIRVFLSSTFRDMQMEREQIVHQVLPWLQKRCRERQVELIFVDLRWGITQEESETGQVIQLCLDQVQRAHETPIFFIALLGDRYGWVPTVLPPTLLQVYPWLAGAMGKSATEMEILYAEQLQQQAPKQTFVYHRSPQLSHVIQTNLGMAEEEESYTQAQHALTQRLLHKADFTDHQSAYENVEMLAEWLGEDLWQTIDKLFPSDQIPDALARERQAHQDFAASRRKIYIADPQLLAQLDELTHPSTRSGRVILIDGASGLGKSAVLANWTAHYQAQHPHTFVVEHYIGGGSNQSAELIPMLQRILAELKQHFGWPEELPQHDKIINEFASWLYKINQPTLLILDAINQLADAKQHTLFWLPATLPAQLSVIVSATPETSATIWHQHQVNSITVAPLSPTAQREVINTFLDRYGKKLDERQQQTIVNASASRNPLYLTALLEELRVFGNYEQLNQRIAHYLQAPDPKSLLALVLARLETDYGQGLIQDMLSLLATAREGLSENELLDLLNIARKHFDPAFFTLMAHLVNKQGQYQFFHTYLAQAVQERYLTAATSADYRQRQVAYWQPQTANIRKQRELPWLLQALGHREDLQAVLLDIELIFAVGNMDKYELLSYWLFTQATDYAQRYVQRGLDWAKDQVSAEDGNILNEMGFFLNIAGHYPQALSLYERSLTIWEQALGQDHPDVATSLHNLASVYSAQGKYSLAERLCQRSLAISKQSLDKNHPHVSNSFNLLAELYREQGKYMQAEPLYKHNLAIQKQALGAEHPDVVISLNNLALLYYAQSQYAQAESLYKHIAILEKALGKNHPNVAINLNNLALLYYAQSQYEQAEPLFKSSLAINEQALGPNHPKVALNLSNLAALYEAQGQYAQAESLCKHSLAIREQALGPDHPETATSLHNLAGLYYVQGQYAEAEPLFKRSLDISEQALGPDHPDVASSLNGLAVLYNVQGQYAEAEPLFKRSLDISEQALGPDHPDVASRLNNLAGLYYDQGQYAQAEPLYQRSLAIFEQALGKDHPDVATSLNNLAGLYYAQGQYAQAEPLYQRSLAILQQKLGPKHPQTQKFAKNLETNNLAKIVKKKSVAAKSTTHSSESDATSGGEHANPYARLNSLIQAHHADPCNEDTGSTLVREAMRLGGHAEGEQRKLLALLIYEVLETMLANGVALNEYMAELHRRLLPMLGQNKTKKQQDKNQSASINAEKDEHEEEDTFGEALEQEPVDATPSVASVTVTAAPKDTAVDLDITAAIVKKIPPPPQPEVTPAPPPTTAPAPALSPEPILEITPTTQLIKYTALTFIAVLWLVIIGSIILHYFPHSAAPTTAPAVKISTPAPTFTKAAMCQAAAQLLQHQLGFTARTTQPNLTPERAASSQEVNILLTSATGGNVIVIGCRATWDFWSVADYLRRVTRFKKRSPQYATVPINAAIVGMDITPQVIDYAADKGLYIISAGDTGLVLQSKGGFIPKTW